MITEEKINEIKRANDIVNVIASYITLEQKGRNYFGVCPFHSDHSPSLSVSPEKQIYKCFSCGEAGNVFSFIMKKENLSFIESAEFLADKAGITLDKKIHKKESVYKENYEVMQMACQIFENNLLTSKAQEARDYLKNRNISDSTIKDFGIGLALGTLSELLTKKYDKYLLEKCDLVKINGSRVYDTFNNRITFPLHNNEGALVAFSARIYQDIRENKYVNSSETDIFIKGNMFFNYFRAKNFIKEEKCVIICEGFMDVIRLWENGYKNAIALMGTSLTTYQYDMIKSMKCEVILNLDQDKAGKTATIQIGDKFISDNIFPSVIVFDKAKDTDELITKYDKDAFEKSYNNRVNYIDFKFNELKSTYDLNSSKELSDYINTLIDEINKITDPILKDIKVNEICKKYNISLSSIAGKLKENKTVVEVKVKNEVKKKISNKNDKSEIKLLSLMMYNPSVIDIFENKLGYLVNDERNDFALEMVEFKNNNNEFILSDFITYCLQNEELQKVYEEVIKEETTDYTKEEIEDYIFTIKKHLIDNQLEKLKRQIKDTLDVNEKIRILKKIEKIKKDVLKW